MLSGDVVRRLTVVATETGLTSVNSKLATTNRLYDQGAVSARRYGAATTQLEQRMAVFARQRDRMLGSFNAGGLGGGVAGTIGMDAASFAAARILPIAAGIGAVAVAGVALNAVWERGADLLERYGKAHRETDLPELDETMKRLTQFQNDTISAGQVKRATELGVRLEDAKFRIDQFFKVHMDITDPALKVQSAWVNIVESIALGVTGLGRMLGETDKLAAKLDEMEKKHPHSVVGGGGGGGSGWGDEGNFDPLVSAYGRLGGALAARALHRKNKDGSPANIGGSFNAMWNDRILGLGKKPEEEAGAAKNAWDRAIDTANRRIAVQEAEVRAIDMGVGAQARLRMEAELTEAARRAGIEGTEKHTQALQRFGEQADSVARRLAEGRLNSNLRFDLEQLGRTDTEQKVASQMRSVYGDDYASQMGRAAAPCLRFGGHLVKPAAQDQHKEKKDGVDERMPRAKAA